MIRTPLALASAQATYLFVKKWVQNSRPSGYILIYNHRTYDSRVWENSSLPSQILISMRLTAIPILLQTILHLVLLKKLLKFQS